MYDCTKDLVDKNLLQNEYNQRKMVRKHHIHAALFVNHTLILAPLFK